MVTEAFESKSLGGLKHTDRCFIKFYIKVKTAEAKVCSPLV